jgi:hypothetical protein
VLQVRVREHDLVDAMAPHDVRELFLGDDRDAVGVVRAGERRRIRAVGDPRDLGRRERDHLDVRVVAVHHVEVVEVAPSGAHDHDPLHVSSFRASDASGVGVDVQVGTGGADARQADLDAPVEVRGGDCLDVRVVDCELEHVLGRVLAAARMRRQWMATVPGVCGGHDDLLSVGPIVLPVVRTRIGRDALDPCGDVRRCSRPGAANPR